MSDKWLSKGGIADKFGVCVNTADKFTKHPNFPKALAVGAPRWPESEIDEWADSNRVSPLTRKR